jgi:hypothetical protein
MLSVESSVFVEGITGEQITDFMLNPTDDRYRAWWPGTHLQLHVVTPADQHLGDLVWMDELVGSRRLRMYAVVVEACPGHRIVWQFRRWVPLPGWLRLEVFDQADGCLVRHTIEVGYRGLGRFLDPIFRLYLSPRFAAELDAHVHTEFPRLRDHLHHEAAGRTSPTRGEHR